MKTIKKINYVVALVMITATLMFTASCKKENLSEPNNLSATNEDAAKRSASSPWHKRSSGVSAPHRGIIEMSTYGQATCYGLMFDESGDPPYQDVSITHNGGATWRVKSIRKLENNYLFGVAATSSNTVHVSGWNYVDGGGNVFRSSDGGASWKREAANAYTHPESFPNVIQFFNPKDGVILGDPQDGYFENYITCDGGNNWRRVASKRIPPPKENEYGYTYATDIHNNTIWTLTIKQDNDFNILNARLFQSDDKGENWYVRNSSMPVNYGDVTMKFRNRSVGLIKNNGMLYRTTDGGTTWKVVKYSGTWFSFDFDNVPGKPGWWISTGGGFPTDDPRSIYGFGSSITYDDGDHWITLDTTVNHTCVDMTSSTHGYSGGITTGSGDDGVFVYSSLDSRLNFIVSAGNAPANNQKVNVPKPSGNVFLPGNKFAALRHHKYR